MKRMQIDDNSEQLDLLMSSLNAIKKELRAIKTNMTFESKLAYTNQDLMTMFDVGPRPSRNGGTAANLDSPLREASICIPKRI